MLDDETKMNATGLSSACLLHNNYKCTTQTVKDLTSGQKSQDLIKIPRSCVKTQGVATLKLLQGHCLSR